MKKLTRVYFHQNINEFKGVFEFIEKHKNKSSTELENLLNEMPNGDYFATVIWDGINYVIAIFITE